MIELMDDHDRAQQDDPLSKLEKGTEMRAKRVDLNMRLSALQEDSHGRYKNDYEMNRMMRKRMRCAPCGFWATGMRLQDGRGCETLSGPLAENY